MDTTSAYDQLGHRITMVDSTGTTSWDFDAWGDLIEMVSPQGTVRYEFNTAREMTRLINVQTGGNLVTEYVRNTAGQVEEIKSAYNEVTTLWYDTFGRLEQKDLPHGLSEFIGYDSQDRLSSIEIRNAATNAVVSSQTYAYDAASNVATHIQDGIRTDYTYDANHQLLSETKRNGVLTTSPITYTGVYTYDANGNRLSRTVNGVQEVYTVDQGDKLLEIRIGGALHRRYGYDLDGRRTSKVAGGQTTAYSWNVDSKLASFAPSVGPSTTYEYNGSGANVSRSTGGNAAAIKRTDSTVLSAVIGIGNTMFTPNHSSSVNGVTTYMHDGIKNVGVSSSASTVQQWQSDSFGNSIGSGHIWSYPFGFGGNYGYLRDGTDSFLLGHRRYDPETGAFLSRDPARDGRNWYVYCGANPTTFVDPTGLWGEHLFDPYVWEQGLLTSWYALRDEMGFGDGTDHTGRPGYNGSRIGWAIADGAMPTGKLNGLRKAGMAASGIEASVKVKRVSSKTLRRQWEQANGRPWPKDENGRNWDVHHITPLSDGGTNDLSIIRPMERRDHIEHHRNNGDSSR